MPIQCPIVFPRLTKAEMKKLDFAVMRSAFATHNTLGCLGDENIYQSHFAHLLSKDGFQAECEVPVMLAFRDFSKTLYLDLAVNQSAIYELKVASALTPAHHSQLMSYLFLGVVN
jgi:GxxExxY protein